MKRKSLLLLFCLFTCVRAFAQQTILHCGKLIDPKNRKVISEVSIIIENDKITDIKNGYVLAGPADKVVDLKNKTVMPGLMDMHVHLEEETRKGGAIDVFTTNPADIAFASTKYARVTLMAGFTTV